MSDTSDRLDARTCWVLAGLGVLFLLTYALPYWVEGYVRLITRIVILAVATLLTVWKDTMPDEQGPGTDSGVDRIDR